MSAIPRLEERLRLRALQKYASCAPLPASPLLSAQDEEPVESSNDPAPASAPTPAQGDVELSPPSLAADPTLTAFAQLAALRTNTRRAFISLLDDGIQHVLAEATRTISPFDAHAHDRGDELVVGAQSFQSCLGICVATFSAFVGGSDHWISHETMIADRERVVIYDLTQEPQTKSLPYVLENADIARFYAEVPLKTDLGLVIGSVCVIDEQPRQASSRFDVQPLHDVARMTIRHLELVRLKEDHNRAERLMQGLSHFNQGKSTISRWITETPGQVAYSDRDSHVNSASEVARVPLTPGKLTAAAYKHSQGSGSSSVTPISQPNEYFRPSHKTASSFTSVSSPAESSETALGRASTSDQSLTPIPALRELNGVADISSMSPVSVGEEDEATSSLVSTSIKGVFSRASNLIRESMDLEAVCFLEISPGGRFDRHSHERTRKSAKRMPLDSGSASGTATSESEVSSVEATSQATNSTSVPERTTIKEQPVNCARLGYSTRHHSSLNDDEATNRYLTVSETVLNRLASRYPSGHVFDYDDFGLLSSGEDTQMSQDSNVAKPRLSARRRLASMVSESFPNARSLIFLPLYDNEKQHLYAGFLGWTTNPQRSLQKNEIVYVAGFSNSIMCEVMRLETLALDKAKSDFMSSMSHELRSPLHGILAATQLIQESPISFAHTELMSMVDTCGRTLLDIMDNLLDHAKINHFTDGKKQVVRPGKKGKKAETYSLVNHIDLALVVEETVASVAAGHSVQKQRWNSFSTTARNPSKNAGPVDEHPTDGADDDIALIQPAIIVAVQPRDSWAFSTQAGAWRRIVMNLVGNALKYTDTGHVRICLEAAQGSSSKERHSKQQVTLTVSDTGQGISESYLKHRLYTPFAQENNLSIGAGLGLSIVHQLVSSLHGTIRLESEVGAGTKVIITVPLTVSPSKPVLNGLGFAQTIEHDLPSPRTACLLGFDLYPAIESEPSGTMSPQAMALLQLKESLSDMLTKWFGFTMSTDSSRSTINIVEESHALMLAQQGVRLPGKLLEISTHNTRKFRLAGPDSRIACVAAPIGPFKLGRALARIFREDPVQVQIDRNGGSPDKRPLLQRLTSVAPQDPFHGDSNESPILSHNPLDLRPSFTRQQSNQTIGYRPSSLATSTPMRLLLVDDNDINLRILASLVRKLNLLYITASNGQEALERYSASLQQKMPIDYIFMDLSMPVMDGLTATRHIRAMEKAEKLIRPARIIALTGLASAQAQQDALASGVDGFYRKPVNLSVLRDLLSEDTT